MNKKILNCLFFAICLLIPFILPNKLFEGIDSFIFTTAIIGIIYFIYIAIFYYIYKEPFFPNKKFAYIYITFLVILGVITSKLFRPYFPINIFTIVTTVFIGFGIYHTTLNLIIEFLYNKNRNS